ncbi:hypothetical protein, partial [Ereboglobus sp. PH5-10]|uniref:beta strand repeat-containing protein n=1 Tax=Ereboglobus sp. PH5-10 TaxID=2940629 RepID=UPI0024067D11
MSASMLQGQVSGTFTGSGTNWGDTANWAGGNTPGSAAGDTALFNASSNASLVNKTISLGSARTIGTLNVIGPNSVNLARFLTIGSTSSPLLIFDNGASSAVINLAGGFNLRFDADIVANSNLVINNNSAVLGKISILGALYAGSRSVTFYNDTSSADITVSGALTAGSIIKNGEGKLILNSASPASITGPVTLNNGAIVIGGDNVLGTGVFTIGANGYEKRISLSGSISRTLSNSLDISASDLVVSREDINTAKGLATLTFNPTAASLTSIGSGTRTITVDAFTGLAFGANQSFSGGTLVKRGSGVLTLGGADSTFSVLDVRAGTVVGYIGGAAVTIGGGAGLFGSGTIRVDGGNSVLEVRGASASNTLNIIDGAHISLTDEATFRLTNATLGLLGGVIDLGSSGVFDYQGNVILGSTSILGAPAAGFDFAGNVAFHDSLNGIASNTGYRINLTGSGTQVISRTANGPVTVSGTLVKTGSGEVVLDTSITSFNTANDFQLANGMLTLTRASQLGSALAFSGSTASLNLGGNNQVLGGVKVGSGASALIYLGGDVLTSTTLGLGTLAFGDNASILRIRDYTSSQISPANYDVVTTTSGGLTAQQLGQIWFYGYNKGASYTGGVLAPDNGLLDSEWNNSAGTRAWHDAGNWVGGDEFNIPNSPGAIARFGSLAGNLKNITVTMNGGVTIGQFYNTGGPDFLLNNGTLTFDSGITGSAAIWGGTQSTSVLSGASVVLKSDLVYQNTSGGTRLRGIVSDDFETSGIARTITVEQGGLGFWRHENTFSGGIVIKNNALVSIYDETSSGRLDGNWLGTGAITIEGSGRIRGYNSSSSNETSSYMRRITNQLILNGNLTAGSIYFDYAGDVALSANRTITANWSTATSAYQRHSVTFGENLNFTGAGGLTLNGAYGKRLMSGNNTFTGGLSVTGGALWVAAGNNDVVLGALSAGSNYLGTGNVTVNGGSIYINTSGKIILNDSTKTLTLSSGYFGHLAENGIYLSGMKIVGGNGSIRTDRGLYFDGSQIDNNLNIIFYGTSPFIASTGSDIYSGDIVINQLTKGESGSGYLDSTINSLTAKLVNANSGRLSLGKDNQLIANTLSLGGGIFNAAGFTNSGIDTLHLKADSTLSLGDTGKLTFNTVGTGTYWSANATLIIQNTDGAWSKLATSDSYVRFVTDIESILGTKLSNIAFTGYDNGAKVEVGDGGHYYLLPNASQTNEWSGAGNDNLWSNSLNWALGSVPSVAGDSASIRDLDSAISGKTIAVDGAHSLGTLNLQAGSSFTLGGSGTLIFNNNGSDAHINIGGSGLKYVSAAWELADNTELNIGMLRASGALEMMNTLSGAGNLVVSTPGNVAGLRVRGNNAGWAGDLEWASSAVRIQILGNGKVLTDSGKFIIGTAATASSTYEIEAVDATRSVTLSGGYQLNSNLLVRRTSNSNGVNNEPSVFRSLTFAGAGELAGTGQRTINVEWDDTGSRPIFKLDGVISGAGGINKTGKGTMELTSTNTFEGDFKWTDGYLRLGADEAIGKGTFNITNNNGAQYVQISKAGGTITLGNRLQVDSGSRYLNLSGAIIFDADSSVVGNSVLTGRLFGYGGSYNGAAPMLVFGEKHVLTGVGGIGTEGITSSLTYRFLGGENTFAGGIITSLEASTGFIDIGASSTQSGGLVTKGPLGTGTLKLAKGGIRVYSDNASVTSQTLGNVIDLGAHEGLYFTTISGNSANRLILSANELQLRDIATTFRIESADSATPGVLQIDSKIVDHASGSQDFIKTGGGVLELTNSANEISGGIRNRAGTVRILTDAAAFTFDQSAVTGFGTGTLKTETADGAFEIQATMDGATVTLDGTGKIELNNSGRFLVSGSNITTILKNGGSLSSTGLAGQEGVLVADRLQSTNYTLGVKLNTDNWTLNAGTVTLARSNLLADARDIYFTDNSRLNINQTAQTINGEIHVSGSAIIDVSGGSAHNPVSILTGNISVNATDSLLTFLGWDADPITGLGSTLIRSSLHEGSVVNGVKLGSNAATSVVVQRNDNGIRVLLPFDQIFVWNGTAGNSQWAMNNWMKQDGLHLPDAQPNAKGAYVTFNTELANLNGATITLPSSRYLNNLVFAGGSNTPYTIGSLGGASLIFQGLSAEALGFIVQTGVSDVTINAGIQLEYDTTAGKGKNLAIEQNGAGWLIFNSKIEGPDSIVTVSGTGAGAVVFNAANMFSKGFVIEGGEVHIGADRLNDGDGGPLGVGAITVVGGTLRGTDGAGNDANRTLVNDIVFAGDLTVAGTGALSITGEGTISADSTVTVTEASGTFVLGSEGGTLSGTSNLVFEGDGKTVVVSELNLAEVTVSGSLTELDGVISGTTKIIKTGTGTLLLLAENTHSGGVEMRGGITGINNNSALGTGTAVLGSGSAPFTSGTLRLDANNLSLANNVTLASTGEVDTQAFTGTLTGV